MSTEKPERVEAVLGSIASKWKPTILFFLVTEGVLRFGELRKRIPRISQRMLTQQLRDLERDGLVKRTFYEQIPPRVEYSVTELGYSLHPIFQSLCSWATDHYEELESSRTVYDKEQKTA